MTKLIAAFRNFANALKTQTEAAVDLCSTCWCSHPSVALFPLHVGVDSRSLRTGCVLCVRTRKKGWRNATGRILLCCEKTALVLLRVGVDYVHVIWSPGRVTTTSALQASFEALGCFHVSWSPGRVTTTRALQASFEALECFHVSWSPGRVTTTSALQASFGVLGCFHFLSCFCIVLSVKVHNIFNIANSVICTINSNYRIAATLCCLETWFVSGV